MSGPVERILTALREHGHEPRKAGAGWCCKCPAHDDRDPSLSIRAGDDGRALVNCHAGCTVDAVCGAIGLRASDLFEPDPSRRNGHAPRTRQSVTVTTTPRKPARNAGIGDGDAKTFPTARDAVAELERRHGPRSTTWTYHNAAGEPVGLVVRWNTPTGKDVRPVSRKADGSGWIIGGMPTPRPLYGLPDLLATPAGSRVHVTEGEKAADAARAVGLVATTSPHGSKSAGKADWSPVAGREVVILPDHDDAGERYADDVARLATAAGAKSVRVVRLVELWADLPEGGDMADLVEHRGGDVDPIRAEVEALTINTEPEAVTPDAPAVPAFAPFPVDVLPEPIRSFVADAAKAIGCDPSYVALPLLSGLASAIGNTHRIALKRGWTEPAIVWTAIVGESGTMKTPAFKLAMKAIRKAQADAFKEHDAARAEWEAQHLRYEAELTGWKRDAAKKRGGDDGYTVAPPEKPTPPIARRYIVSDTTTEALAPILLGNPRGVLLARDELAGWLGSFDRYAKAGKAGADSAHWLSMHNGESMTIDRKTGIPPTIHVPSASVSITGGIQPGILGRALGQEHHESGMAARVLYAMPPRKAKRWTESDVDADTEAAVAAVFDRLFSLTMEVDPEGPLLEPDCRPRLVRLADDGKAAWVRFYNEHATEQAELSGDLSAAWSKLEGYAARLALVVHLTRWAAGDATLRDPARVDEASIAAGVVLARWFGDEARRVYAILSESDDDRETRRLVEWIERKGGTVTARDLTHGVRAYRGDPDAAERALSALVEAGIGCWEADAHGPKGGRPAQRFRLVSTVTVTETPANAGKDVGYGDGDTGDTATDAGDGWGEL
ncbi:MAG: DUF3987 domain-containing protein [Phycisphaeraceae bacterium]|nr:DUF3987 domain-containing protein [Phycisphaeraceae bacterium]